MGQNWQPDLGQSRPPRAGPGDLDRLTLSVPRSILPILAILGCVLAVGGTSYLYRANGLQETVDQLTRKSAGNSGRERELEATIARQHRELQAAQGELQSLRFRVEAVELQLDGVDFLSKQLRTELGLPQTAGTWAGAGDPPKSDASPSQGAQPNADSLPAPAGAQGGAYDPSATLERGRVALAQQRLAAGLRELYGLLEATRSKKAAANDPTGTAARRPIQSRPANWPARGEVTSRFGWRAFRGLPNYHTGIDVAEAYGTAVASTADGVAVGSGWQPGYGLCVLIQHGDGYNTLYAHLSDTAVKLGDVVAPGTIIGWSGSSGNSTGPHLHYEVWKDGRPQDPWPFMN